MMKRTGGYCSWLWAAGLCSGLAIGVVTSGCATSGTSRPSPTEVALVTENASATVVLHNAESGFVVLDFGGQPLPAPGTQVTVYRTGQRTGTVRVTEPVRGRFATADIVEGSVQIGDEIR